MENAQVFLENLERVNKTKDQKVIKKFDPGFSKHRGGSVSDFSGDTGLSSHNDFENRLNPIEEALSFTDSDFEDGDAQSSNAVILNLAPTKNDKPKDKLFT